MPNENGRKKDELARITIGASLLLGLLLVILPLSTVHGQIAAFAAGGNDQSQDKGHGKSASENSGDNDNNNSSDRTANGNQTSSATHDSQGDEHRQYGNSTGSMSNNDEEHSKAEQKRAEYASETAKERHEEHLTMHGPTVGPYSDNMSYTLTASGTASSVSDNSTSTHASISLNLSVWKSTKGLVSMDIMNGTVTIGNETIPVHNGHAYYLVHNHQFRVLGFVTTDTNATSASHGNQTTSEHVQVIKLTSSSDKTGENVLPTSSSEGPLKISILSPQSKLASEWFLKMDGDVKLG